MEEKSENGWDEYKNVVMHRLDDTDGRLDKISTKLGDLVTTRQADVIASKKERAEQFTVLHETMREVHTAVIKYEMTTKEELAVCKVRIERLERVVYGTFGIIGTTIGLYVLNSLLNLV